MTTPQDTFKAQWMFIDPKQQGKNWKMIASLIEKFIQSNKLKLSIEFTAPEIEVLKRENAALREMLQK